jgi:hypothetical protein
MWIARLICLASAAVCLGVGGWSLWDPVGVAEKIGYVLAGPAGQVEFVTVYGGFYLGLGLFLLAGTVRTAWLVPALAMSTLGAGGAMAGRLGGAIAIGTGGAGMTFTLLASEVVWAGLSALGWWRAARARG